ncbi:MAG: tetratricopeptide repeat protein [Gemmatimonadales bacterium]
MARRIEARPDDGRLRGALGIAYAGLGRKQEAIREGERGVELIPVSRDAYQGYYRVLDLARIYTMVGEHAAAVDRLAYLLSVPGHLTVAWLKADPTWDPLRGHPRFQRLLRGGTCRACSGS